MIGFYFFLKFVRSLYCVANQNVILYLNFFNIRVRHIVRHKKYKNIILICNFTHRFVS